MHTHTHADAYTHTHTPTPCRHKFLFPGPRARPAHLVIVAQNQRHLIAFWGGVVLEHNLRRVGLEHGLVHIHRGDLHMTGANGEKIAVTLLDTKMYGSLL